MEFFCVYKLKKLPRIVYRLFSVTKCARPHSTVFPLALSSSEVSMIYAIHQLSRFFCFASFSYFATVRSSTSPVFSNICPDKVDFPASTWPMKTRFKCSRESCAFTFGRFGFFFFLETMGSSGFESTSGSEGPVLSFMVSQNKTKNT